MVMESNIVGVHLHPFEAQATDASFESNPQLYRIKIRHVVNPIHHYHCAIIEVR